jgi:hypothetical protein
MPSFDISRQVILDIRWRMKLSTEVDPFLHNFRSGCSLEPAVGALVVGLMTLQVTAKSVHTPAL